MELKDAQALAELHIEAHGLDKQNWSFKFNQSKSVFGHCCYRLKQIVLSVPLTAVNDEVHIENTILHEIAHALCPWQGHNDVWRRKAISIGCTGETYYNSALAEKVLPWVDKCPNCLKQTTGRRAMKPRTEYACTPCCKTYNNDKWSKDFILTWTKEF